MDQPETVWESIEMASLQHLDLKEIDFDALGEDALNALPIGVMKLSADGAVLFYSQGEADNSGRSRESCEGRNFFADLAPCADNKEFRGRFAAVARGEAREDSFEFFFTFYVPRLRALIDIRAAATPGEYWVAIRPIEVLSGFRDVDALRRVEAAVARSAGEDGDMSSCDREEIHIPDAIQPHGALIVLDADLLHIKAISENLGEHLGVDPSGLPGARAERVFPPLFLDDLATALPIANSHHSGVIGLGHGGRRFDFLALRGELDVLIEIEPLDSDLANSEPFLVSKFLSLVTSRLDLSFGRDQVSQMVAREVRAVTGFDRVMVYRFDEGGDGEVIAEAKAADWAQSFMGLRFPASDIPVQARRLYRRSRMRHLPDNDYLPSPLLKAKRDGPPIDLSLSWLRSIAPVHREYHRNMGVAATFSASIMAGGELWGLIIGHHRTPLRLGFKVRQAIGLAADLVGPHLTQEEAIEETSLRTEHEHVHRRLLDELARSEDLLATLISGSVSLADLFLDSYGAACRISGQIHLIGHTPEEAVVSRLIDWLSGVVSDDVWATDRLVEAYPEIGEHREIASGLLAMPLDRRREDMIVWFRPEVARTIAWAGDPRGKSVENGMILPRKGFDRWVEQTTARSRPWPTWKLDLARQLRNAMFEVAAAQTARLRMANRQLEIANETKRRLLSEISHDFRTMLTDVIGFTEAVKSGIAGPLSPKQEEYLSNVVQTGNRMLAMVETVLNTDGVEASAPRLGEFMSEPPASSN